MPDWKSHIRSCLASLRLSPARESEIIEELSQHLEDRWRELVASGVSEDEATKLALAGFRDGDLLARHLAPLRQAHAPEPITPGAPARHMLADLWQDLRYAARTLRRRPTFASAAILTLALCIGSNAAIFTIVNAILLRPLPLPHSEQLQAVYTRFLPSVLGPRLSVLRTVGPWARRHSQPRQCVLQRRGLRHLRSHPCRATRERPSACRRWR